MESPSTQPGDLDVTLDTASTSPSTPSTPRQPYQGSVNFARVARTRSGDTRRTALTEHKHTADHRQTQSHRAVQSGSHGARPAPPRAHTHASTQLLSACNQARGHVGSALSGPLREERWRGGARTHLPVRTRDYTRSRRERCSGAPLQHHAHTPDPTHEETRETTTQDTAM